jgi:hypothetical protein
MPAFHYEPFDTQQKLWPRAGRHILAQFDDTTVIVYQAYNSHIGRYAVTHQNLGSPAFSLSRMSWIKPNFLWMMYRSGWGTKPDQEITLALRIRRTFFDSLLAAAVPSTFNPAQFLSRSDWSAAVGRSAVLLQWDPDHHPTGAPLDRRSIQLGLRDNALRAFAQREILEITDLTDFVTQQRLALARSGTAHLITPRERTYSPAIESAHLYLGQS